MPESDHDTVQFGLPDVYDMVVDVNARLTSMDRKLDQALAKGEVVDDHETRIRGIERWKYALPTSVVVAAVSAVAAAFK